MMLQVCMRKHPEIENLESIVMPLAQNTQILADNGYSTNETSDFLEQKAWMDI